MIKIIIMCVALSQSLIASDKAQSASAIPTNYHGATATQIIFAPPTAGSKPLANEESWNNAPHSLSAQMVELSAQQTLIMQELVNQKQQMLSFQRQIAQSLASLHEQMQHLAAQSQARALTLKAESLKESEGPDASDSTPFTAKVALSGSAAAETHHSIPPATYALAAAAGAKHPNPPTSNPGSLPKGLNSRSKIAYADRPVIRPPAHGQKNKH